MFLVGRFDLTIDSKNRLSVPFMLRRKLDETNTGHGFYVLPGLKEGTLILYPDKYLERLRGQAVPPEGLSAEAYEGALIEFSSYMAVEPDSQGRILLPDRLLKMAGIKTEVTLTGVVDHLCLWDRARFEEFEKSKWPEYQRDRVRLMSELRQQQSAAKGPAPAAASATAE